MRHQPVVLDTLPRAQTRACGLGFAWRRKETGQGNPLGRLKVMTRLVFSDFDEYDQALRGVSDHERILRSRPATRLEFACHRFERRHLDDGALGRGEHRSRGRVKRLLQCLRPDGPARGSHHERRVPRPKISCVACPCTRLLCQLARSHRLVVGHCVQRNVAVVAGGPRMRSQFRLPQSQFSARCRPGARSAGSLVSSMLSARRVVSRRHSCAARGAGSPVRAAGRHDGDAAAIRGPLGC